MTDLKGHLIDETFEYDGGRQVTVYVPPEPPEAVVFCADGGWHISRLSAALERANESRTMVVGVHGMPDDNGRFKEFLPGVDAERFAAHEQFFVQDTRNWLQARFGLALPIERTAVWGASVGGEFAFAIGHRHPEVYGAIFCASPDESVLSVEYPAATGNPAGRDVWCDSETTNWTPGRAISFQVKPDHAIRLSVSFLDRNREVTRIGFAPQGQRSGRLMIGRIVVVN